MTEFITGVLTYSGWFIFDYIGLLNFWLIVSVIIFICITVVSKILKPDDKISFYGAFFGSLLWFICVPVLIILIVLFFCEDIYDRFVWREKTRR